MKKKRNVFQLLGFLLILAALCLLLGRELWGMHNSKQAARVAAQIEAGLPRKTVGTPEEYSNPDMPVLQLDGRDFSGLVSVPSFGVCLPLGSEWNAPAFYAYPCRFWGSVYDHSLIIGGSSQKGQFDFLGRLDLGEKILVTDMMGAEFAYRVTGIDRRKHADMQTFGETESDLILFARDTSTLDHLLVRCEFAPLA